VISAKPRVISAARALSPEAGADGDAGGQRDDVLERAAQFRADDVVREVEPQPPGREPRLQVLAVLGQASVRPWAARGDVLGEARPVRTATRAAGQARGDQFARTQSRLAVDPLAAADERRARRAIARVVGEEPAERLRGHGEEDAVCTRCGRDRSSPGRYRAGDAAAGGRR
jgi:hypothetical protein